MVKPDGETIFCGAEYYIVLISLQIVAIYDRLLWGYIIVVVIQYIHTYILDFCEAWHVAVKQV